MHSALGQDTSIASAQKTILFTHSYTQMLLSKL